MRNLKLIIKKSLFILAVIFSWLNIAGCTPFNEGETLRAEGDTTSLQGLQNMGAPVKRDLSKGQENKKMRYQAIQDTALGIGAQSGLAWESKNIDEQLMRQVSTLDKIYAFNLLILDHNVLPPVLLEGRNVFNLADQNTIRIADRRYKIAKQARFVTTAPNWRQYLWMDYMKPSKPNDSLLPESEYEEKLWDYYVSIGWYEGMQQAGIIFSNNVARLKEDFSGMILYRKLLAQNMVSPPYVAQTDLGVTGDQGEINIDDQVLRITALPQLNPDSNDWNPVIAESNKEEIQRYNKMEKLVEGNSIAVPNPTTQKPPNGWQPVISNMSNHE